MADKYRLRIQCEINRTEDNGAFTGDRLSVNDELLIEAQSFFQVAQILGQFHELAETIRGFHGA